MKTWIRNGPQNLAFFLCFTSFLSRKYVDLAARKFTFIQYVVLLSFSIYRIDTLVVSFENLNQPENATQHKYYFVAHFVVFVGTFVFFMRSVLRRNEIFWTIKQSKWLAKEIPSNGIYRARRKGFQCFKIFLALLNLSVLIYYIVLYDVFQILGIFVNGEYPENTLIRFLSKCLSRPVRFWSSLALYSYVFGRMVELEANEAISGQIFRDNERLGLETTLPTVTGDETSCEKISIFYTEDVLHYITSGAHNFDHAVIKTLREYFKVKSFSFVMHEFFFGPVSFLIIKGLIFFPIILVFYSQGAMKTVSKVSTCVQWVDVLAPVLLNICWSYKDRLLWVKAKCEIFRSNGTKRRHLVKFLLFAKSQYPGPFLKLFEFDSDLLLSIVDVLVLITTALFTKEN